MTYEPPPPDGGDDLLGAAPGLARIAAAAWWRTAGWAAETSLRTSGRVIRAAVRGESPAQLMREAGPEVRRYMRHVLGIADPERGPLDGAGPEAAHRSEDGEHQTATDLRLRGAELLRQSADVDFDDEFHPAYLRILDDLAPDEARILRLLHQSGPQPSIDVRTGVLPLNMASELVAPGLSMIGQEAGCRHLDRVPAYLNNLFRLGLVWFSRETVSDHNRYQVLEAQPDVLEAMRHAGRTRTVRRSIHLTPFGSDFCALCLPQDTAEIDALGGPAPPDPEARATDSPPADAPTPPPASR